ncbi:MAG TPA: hypothetical protein PKL94_00690 [Saprospiraceae bacterium]|nr:hypothetical protein [Saprospiraceae bacterium]HMX81827.1 hypothetical protein [Saprospiraceae bacterium]HMZ72496.1 hypothetical protein [Saprospiraceae bacterium]HNE64614.1 hypothetical protein [Saprospiraceae bacterium]HNL28461.1 hypothetical protein [Saprospiraceae bacterium]
MKLKITQSTTIGEVKKHFTDAYPFLKLEFFSKPHDAYKTSPAKFIVHDETKSLLEVGMSEVVEAELNIEGSTSVKSFEAEGMKYGLNLQVLRRSASTWLATTVTDNLSLHEQNRKGEASTFDHSAPKDDFDYREQE